MHAGVFDHAGSAKARAGASARVAFRHSNTVGTRNCRPFAARWPACTLPCRRFAGPLAGFERGLAHAAGELVVTVPCDSPFLPRDLVARLRAALEALGADAAVAKTGTQTHPVFCLMRRSVHASLTDFLARGERKIDRWTALLSTIEVDFSDQADAFLNINTREELSGLEARGG